MRVMKNQDGAFGPPPWSVALPLKCGTLLEPLDLDAPAAELLAMQVFAKRPKFARENGLVRRAGRKRPTFEAENGLPDGIKMNTMNMNAFLVAWPAFGRCRLSWPRLNMRKCKSYADSRRSQLEIHKSRFTNHAQMQMQITNRDSRRPCLC